MPQISRQLTRMHSVLLRFWLQKESRRDRSFVVSGFPKSGTTWVTQLVAGALGLMYERGNVRLRREGVVLHTHGLAFAGQARLIYVVRDPREIVCSAYRAQHGNIMSRGSRIDVDFALNVLRSFPGSRSSWKEHILRAINQSWCVIRFEDLKSHGAVELVRCLSSLDIDFELDQVESAFQSSNFDLLRHLSPVDGFLNISAIDSWKDVLHPDAEDQIFEVYGETIRQLNLLPQVNGGIEYVHSRDGA